MQKVIVIQLVFNYWLLPLFSEDFLFSEWWQYIIYILLFPQDICLQIKHALHHQTFITKIEIKADLTMNNSCTNILVWFTSEITDKNII